jgi:hypothetical protein
MDDLEKQLRKAMARRDAPAWFEAKVLAAAAHERPQPSGFWRRLIASGRIRWATAVLAGAAVVASGALWEQQREQRERAAGQAAKAKLELALKITRVKLRKIEQKLNDLERN